MNKYSQKVKNGYIRNSPRYYAQYLLYGVFYELRFDNWDDYYEVTFNPDCKILRLVDTYKN